MIDVNDKFMRIFLWILVVISILVAIAFLIKGGL